MSVYLEPSSKTGAEALLAIELEADGWQFLRQFPYAPGRRFKADFLVYGPADAIGFRARVLVEIQGGVMPFKRTRKDGTVVTLPGAHGSVEGILRDNERLNEASIAGYSLLRFIPDQRKEVIPTLRRYFEGVSR